MGPLSILTGGLTAEKIRSPVDVICEPSIRDHLGENGGMVSRLIPKAQFSDLDNTEGALFQRQQQPEASRDLMWWIN